MLYPGSVVPLAMLYDNFGWQFIFSMLTLKSEDLIAFVYSSLNAQELYLIGWLATWKTLTASMLRAPAVLINSPQKIRSYSKSILRRLELTIIT